MAFHPVNILIGDVRDRLRELPADSFDCVVTSPPYWGLRDYDVAGQIGLEATLGEHLAVMVDVCREVRRVIKPEGVFWLNYGDCYATSPNGRSAADTKALSDDDRTFRDKPFSTVGPIYEQQPDTRQAARRGRAGKLGNGGINGASVPDGRVVAGGYLKAKDLCMIPQRLAIALQEDGWWVRSLLPWVKRNGMPESISDRPATSIEHVIMLTRSARYYYNADAIRRPASASTHARIAQDVAAQDVAAQAGSTRANGGRKINGPMRAVVRKSNRSKESFAPIETSAVLEDRNFRNSDLFFDSIAPPHGLLTDEAGHPLAIDANPQAFRDAHFATFPPKLVEPLIKAGCPAGGSVLDPFGGAGTTALVAWRLQRACTLIELNPEYAEITRARLQAAQGWWSDIHIDAGAPSENAA